MRPVVYLAHLGDSVRTVRLRPALQVGLTKPHPGRKSNLAVWWVCAELPTPPGTMVVTALVDDDKNFFRRSARSRIGLHLRTQRFFTQWLTFVLKFTAWKVIHRGDFPFFGNFFSRFCSLSKIHAERSHRFSSWPASGERMILAALREI